MAFGWLANDDPLLVVFESSLPSSTKKKRCQSLEPLWQNFLDPRMKKSYPAKKYGLVHLIMQGFSDFRIDAEILLWYENVNMYFFIVQKMFRLEDWKSFTAPKIWVSPCDNVYLSVNAGNILALWKWKWVKVQNFQNPELFKIKS